MKPRSSDNGFTLIELLVAMAVGALVIVMLLSILSGTMSLSRKANDSLLGANAAAAVLDLIGTDLESLVPLSQPNFEYLHLVNDPVELATNAAKLIMLTSSSTDVGSAATEAGQVRAVVYRLAHLDVLKASGTNNIYGIYRAVETNAATVFSDYIGSTNLSTNSLFTAAAQTEDFLAGNIVDFRVRFYAPGAATELNTNASDAIRIHATNIFVGGTAKNTNAATVEVSLTYLEEAGAKLLKNGAPLSLDEIKKRYGYTVSKKVPLRTPIAQ